MTGTIADAIRRDCGFGLDVPEGNGWLRMPCPYCGRSGGTANRGAHRHPAALNHSIGWFACHACGVRRSASYDESVATRFGDVLRLVALKAWQKFPGVLTLDEARAHANERLAVYDGPDDGSCAEVGVLPQWEKKAAGEDELDGFVYHALWDDLWDHARKLIRQHEHYAAAGDGQTYGTGVSGLPAWELDFLTGLLDTKTWEDWKHMEDGGWFSQSRYPVPYATKVHGLTQDEVKQLIGWTERELRERLDAEKQDLAQAFYQQRQGRP